MKHTLLVIITVVSLVAGIVDLGINYAILKSTSHEDFLPALKDAYSHKGSMTPTPAFMNLQGTIKLTPQASVSAMPAASKAAFQKAVLSPVPSHATLNK